MLGLFNPENRFWNFMTKIVDVICISLLWMVCSLPIITCGAATASLYNFTLHQVYDAEDSVLHGFFSCLRKCFKKATVIWLAELFIWSFLALDCYLAWRFFVLNSGILATAVLAVIVFVTLICIMASIYVYPLLVIYDFPIKKIFRDSVIISVTRLFHTISVLAIWAAAVIAIFYLSGAFFVLIGLAAFFSSYPIRAALLSCCSD